MSCESDVKVVYSASENSSHILLAFENHHAITGMRVVNENMNPGDIKIRDESIVA